MKIQNLSKMIKELEKFFRDGEELWFEMEYDENSVLNLFLIIT